MNIEIKEAAREQLNQIKFKKNQGIRIAMEQENTCTLHFDYQLIVDDQKEGDMMIYSSNIPFIISENTQKLLPNTLYLNYDKDNDYKLYSDEEILKSLIQLKTN